MSYPSTKRQRSNTSRESANKTAPTAAPGLRQSPAQATRGLYAPPTAYHGNGAYDTRPQPISYASYSPNPVRDGYGAATGYPPPSSLAYNNAAALYDPQQQVSFTAYHQAYAGGHHHQPPPHPPPQQQQQQQYHPASEPSSENRHYSPAPVIGAPVGQPNPGPNPRQPIQSYADVYSHPSPHSTIYTSNNSTSSYQDPVAINTQYSLSPHTTPSGDGHNPDDQYGQDSEDAGGEMTDEQPTEQIYPDTTRSMSQDLAIPTDLSKPPDKCACKKGRGKKKQPCTWCVCTKHGQKCGAQCGCGDACASPFRDLTTFFGPSDRFPKACGPNACFANWLVHQPNIDELDTDLMVDMVLYDHPSWDGLRVHNPALAKWESKWKKAKEASGSGNNTTKKAKKNAEDRQRLEFELLRGGLGNANQDDFHGFWYSFCNLRWLMTDEWEHCPECRDCRPSNEWHCEKHGKCTTGQMCSGCHGGGGSIGSSSSNSNNNNAHFSAVAVPPPSQQQQQQQYLSSGSGASPFTNTTNTTPITIPEAGS